MAELSPAAQAVLDAFENASDGEYVEGVWVVNERTMLAAALRTAADQVTPANGSRRNNEIRADIFAIADELWGDSKENKRPDRLIAGDVWEFEWEVQVKGKRKPQLQKLKFKVIGYHQGQCAWELMSLDGEHYCYLMEFTPQYEDMTYIGHLDQDELKAQQ
jgi:hypothetical protein